MLAQETWSPPPPDIWLTIVFDRWPLAFWIVTLAMMACIVSFGVLGGTSDRLLRFKRFLSALAIFSLLWLVLIQALAWSFRLFYVVS